MFVCLIGWLWSVVCVFVLACKRDGLLARLLVYRCVCFLCVCLFASLCVCVFVCLLVRLLGLLLGVV